MGRERTGEDWRGGREGEGTEKDPHKCGLATGL